MRAVHRRGVGARPLAFVLVDVDPAAGEALPHHRLIFVAERRHRVNDPLEHVLVLVFLVEGHQRDREVVDVIGRHAEHLPPQPMVAAQRLDAGRVVVDQVLDDEVGMLSPWSAASSVLL